MTRHSLTSSWSSGKCVRFGAGSKCVRFGGKCVRFGAGSSASVLGSYQDLVNLYCSLLTRRTVYGRAAGNSPRTTTIINKWNETWKTWKRNSVMALQDHCSYKAPTTNHHIKQTFLFSPWWSWLHRQRNVGSIRFYVLFHTPVESFWSIVI